MLGQLATTGIGSGTSIDIIKFHAMFSVKNADMILSSKDDIHFRVRSQLLQDTSEWFRTLLSLPKNVPGANETDILRLDETGDVLAALLRMASGMEIPELSSIEFCEDILNAAEKYEMPGPISIIRLALSSSLLSTSPIRIYGIAASRNWVAEAKAASTRTLSIDLFHADNIPEISRLDSHILTKLLLLHHTRRQAFKAALDNASVFYASRDIIGSRAGQLLMIFSMLMSSDELSSPHVRIAGRSCISRNLPSTTSKESSNVCRRRSISLNTI
ncbi:hypothetical protein CERSUDRAFT_110370 [Gelatoporia subvermispora B]|uniref:BTB domain-containing protein n=1 Tax=Ceriporiopsis subvermispora (strain B) TaxID=914234 RepID=M2RTN1_CERS8|nr:hypothetical protein CERSUDRAFT_110370 [Gelatoporia subvermispora B]